MSTITGSPEEAVTAQFLRAVPACTAAVSTLFFGVDPPNATAILSNVPNAESAESRDFARSAREIYQRAIAAAEGLQSVGAVARDRGDVFWYDYGGSIKERPCVIVSVDTGGNTVVAVEITSTEFNAPHVIAVTAMHCHPKVTGYVRCDRITTIPKEDPYWRRFVLTLDDHDMALVEQGLRAIFGLQGDGEAER